MTAFREPSHEYAVQPAGEGGRRQSDHPVNGFGTLKR